MHIGGAQHARLRLFFYEVLFLSLVTLCLIPHAPSAPYACLARCHFPYATRKPGRAAIQFRMTLILLRTLSSLKNWNSPILPCSVLFLLFQYEVRSTPSAAVLHFFAKSLLEVAVDIVGRQSEINQFANASTTRRKHWTKLAWTKTVIKTALAKGRSEVIDERTDSTLGLPQARAPLP